MQRQREEEESSAATRETETIAVECVKRRENKKLSTTMQKFGKKIKRNFAVEDNKYVRLRGKVREESTTRGQLLKVHQNCQDMII